jgi:signal transduction histidine kinase
MRWPDQASLALALLSVAVAVAVAAQRHQFTSPSLASLALLLVVAPWVLMAARCGESLTGWRKQLLYAAWSVDVVAATLWIVIGYPNHNSDFAPFLLVILVAVMSADMGPYYGGALAVGIIVLITGLDLIGGYTFGTWVIWGFAFAISWMGGTGVRWQMEVTAKLADAHAELARRAAEQERHRLAREVHDLIAHSLAVSMLHLTGARLALEAGADVEALEALQEAENAGRTAMAEIHRTVGLLGSKETDGGLMATPSAVDVPRLVNDFGKAGLVIDATVSGDLEGVGLAEGLAAYRIVQESLSNAVKHAPGTAVHLSLAVTADQIEVLVANRLAVRTGRAEGRSSDGSTGSGLRGMRERTDLLGGRFSAHDRDGSWTITATIPLTGPFP